MKKTSSMVYKLLVVGVIVLFCGISVVSSTDNIVKDNNTNYKVMKSNYESKKVLSPEKIAYSYCAYCPFIPEGPVYFYLDDPGTIMSFDIEDCGVWCCATWTNIGKMLVFNEAGELWEINLCNRTASKIGGGDVNLYGLAYNPVNDKLYGISMSDLFEINISTGEETYIGSFGLSDKTIISIAINTEGRAFIWDILFSGDSTLWEVDLETGEATEIGSMGENLCYAAYGAFDWETGILWLAAYSSSGFLATVDIDTGELTHMGNFQLDAHLRGLAIPYTSDYCPPKTTISLNPPEPDGLNGWYVSDVNVTLNATDDLSGVNVTYCRIDSGEWITYTEPFTLSKDGDDILIEYYSVDYVENIENMQSFMLDVDQTEPDIALTYEIVGGNKWQGWDWEFMAHATEKMSGMDYVVFYIDNLNMSTVYGSGPDYWWEVTLPGFLPNIFNVKGLIYNLEIDEDYVKFNALIIRVSRYYQRWSFPVFLGVRGYDKAGNMGFDETWGGTNTVSINPGIYLFKSIVLPNNYFGHIGDNYISARFNLN